MVLNVMVLLELICPSVFKGSFWVPGRLIVCGVDKVLFLFFSPFYSEPPNSLDLNGSQPRRIKLTAPNINLSLDQSEGSVLSDDNLDTPDEIDINVDDLDTPDEADSFEYTGQGSILDCKCRVRLCFFFYDSHAQFHVFQIISMVKAFGS